MTHLNEFTLAEQPLLDWFRQLGYDIEFGPDLAPGGIKAERESFREVLLLPRLKRALRRLNPDLPESAIDAVAEGLAAVEHPGLDIANKETYRLITEGVPVEFKKPDGEAVGRRARVIDLANPTDNEFLAVNQFAVQGVERVRRADVVVFVNGIPLAVFEVKSPTSMSGSLNSAHRQLNEYKRDIPDLFKYNQILVVSDLFRARHGTISSTWEWFSTWKGIENESDRPAEASDLEVLAKGVFAKSRLIDIIGNFTVFEADSVKDATRYTKKMCLYHQYYGVNRAVRETLRAARPRGSKKIGVFWHTQGSGKTLSMVFFVNKAKLLPELRSPTFVFLTDRNDLDGQMFKTFLRAGYTTAKQAATVADLKARLKDAAGELIFSTIQKFDTENEALSVNDNIVVIADEAHRSQYAKLAGNVRDALPNALFMGITGTPISLRNRDTQLVFGDHISTYKINQAVEDGATVPIYYEGRLVPLHLTNQFIDEDFEALMGEQEVAVKEEEKRKWAKLEEAIGAEDRLGKIAADIVEHFNGRGLEGKAMVVTASRRIAARLYGLMKGLSGAPEAAVVISKPEDFRGQIQEQTDSKELEKQFKNPDDKLKMVIVCDMWLTGFDVPPLHTMYIDKPLKNHALMQAIARVNRIFRDKKGGLIVDYIGIADDLKKALGVYSTEDRKEAMIPIEEVIAKMLEKYDIVRAMFAGVDYSKWKNLAGAELTGLFHGAVNAILSDDKGGEAEPDKKNRFLREAEMLFRLHALVMPHAAANRIRNDVEFFQAVKRTITKLTVTDPGFGIELEVETAIRELVSRSIAAEGAVDIFELAGKSKPEVSLFDEKFLDEVRKMKFRNVAIEVLRKLLNDELRLRIRKNAARYRSLLELLEYTIEQYENRLMESAKVIEALIELAGRVKEAEAAGTATGLGEEELAVHDCLDGEPLLAAVNTKALATEIIRSAKEKLSIDWAQSEVVRARIRGGIRLSLLRNGCSTAECEAVIERVFGQIEALYRDWEPLTSNKMNTTSNF
jgi:type I restriction enzyme R subunit